MILCSEVQQPSHGEQFKHDPKYSHIYLLKTVSIFTGHLFICSFHRYLLVVGRDIGNSKTLDLKEMLEDVLQAC